MAEKKSTKSKEDTRVQKETNATFNPERRWRMGGLFWGLLLITVGTLLVLDNFEVLEVNFSNILRLWPLAIVAAGVSMLSLRGYVATLITLLLILGSLGLIVLAATDNIGDDRETTSDSISFDVADEVDTVDVDIKAGAGKVIVQAPQNQTEAVKATLTSNYAMLNSSSELDGSTQNIDLSLEGSSGWWRGGTSNELAVDLNREVTYQLSIDSGASDINVDLSQARIREFVIDSGASNIDVTLGAVLSEQYFQVDAGASAVKIRVPRSAGVQLQFDGGLTGKDVADLNDVGDGRFESAGFADSENKIFIDADLGLAGFELIRY